MGKAGKVQIIDGYPVPAYFCPETWKKSLFYKARSDDVILSTYPKCGTTWTQHILSLIYFKGRPFKNANEFFRRFPFLEMAGQEAVVSMERPGVIKTHFPFEMTPYNPLAKYVYVVRNPKDACISLFHHQKNFPGYEFDDGVFDDFFEEYINGRVEWGCYFDHLMGWYKHKDDPNVLFITYESIKRDHPGAVKKMARFLGDEFGDMVEQKPDVLAKIVEYSSVSYMKANSDSAFSDMFAMSPEEIEKDPHITKGLKTALKGLLFRPTEKSREFNFIRKGIVGDWRNMMSDEQSRRIDEKLREKAKGVDTDKLFEGALRR